MEEKKGFTTRTINLNDPIWDKEVREEDPEWVKKDVKKQKALGLKCWVCRDEDGTITVGTLLSDPNAFFDVLSKYFTFDDEARIREDIEEAKKSGSYLSAITNADRTILIWATMKDPSISMKEIFEQHEKESADGLIGIHELCPGCDGEPIYVGLITEDNKCPRCGYEFDANSIAHARAAEAVNEERRKKAGKENPFLVSA